MNQSELTTLLEAPEAADDSSSIAEITVSLRRILSLTSQPPIDADDLLSCIRYEAAHALAAARSLSEPALVS